MGRGFGHGFAGGLTAGASLGSVLRAGMDKSDLAEAMQNATMEDKTTHVEVNAPDQAAYSQDAETGNYVARAYDDQGGLTDYGKQIQNATEDQPIQGGYLAPQYESKTERVEKQFASPNERRLAMLQGGIDHYIRRGDHEKAFDMQQRMDDAKLREKQGMLVDHQIKGAERSERQNAHTENVMKLMQGAHDLSDDDFMSQVAGIATQAGNKNERFAYGTDPQSGATFVLQHDPETRKINSMLPMPKTKDGRIDREAVLAQTLAYTSPEAFREYQKAQLEGRKFEFDQTRHQDDMGLKKQQLGMHGAGLVLRANADQREQELHNLNKDKLTMVSVLEKQAADAIKNNDPEKYRMAMQQVVALQGKAREEDKGKLHATSGPLGTILYDDKWRSAVMIDATGKAKAIDMSMPNKQSAETPKYSAQDVADTAKKYGMTEAEVKKKFEKKFGFVKD